MLEFSDSFPFNSRIHTIPEDSLKELQETLLGFLDHHSGQVRHYTVNALLDLGENKKEVILRLVRGLADPDFAVREEIKVALKQMAGGYQSLTIYYYFAWICVFLSRTSRNFAYHLSHNLLNFKWTKGFFVDIIMLALLNISSKI